MNSQRRALVIDEASFGSDQPSVAIRLNNLGQLLQDANRLGEVELRVAEQVVNLAGC
jgi:hypothetical protein